MAVPQPEPRSAPLEWGVYVADQGNPSSDLDTVTSMAGDSPDYVMRFAAVGEPVPIGTLDAISSSGRMPVLSLEPWDPSAGPDQPEWRLETIVGGQHDDDLGRWATELADFGQPVVLRFAHEMNGSWYPWSVEVGDNSAAGYVAAWNHMHAIFEAAGADNVLFAWSPNVPFGGHQTPFADLYPGSDQVDILGIDGYNQDTDTFDWLTPEQLFREGIAELEDLDPTKPIVVMETASTEGASSENSKAMWIGELVRYLDANPRIGGFIWFQDDKEKDWRFNSTAESQGAMRAALAARWR
ncbi:MAG: glycoside hydrolase family 26 protein [Rhodoglobus sp.]